MHVYGELSGTLSSSGQLSGFLSATQNITGQLTVPQYVTPPLYEGPYEVTPSNEEQVLNTDAFYMNGNIYTASGVRTQGTSSGGTSKNAQVVQSTTRTSASTLTAIGSELTVSKTGTYDIYYSCFRTNTSASYTWATRLYINGTAYGTAENTTWTNNQQNTHLSNISLTTGDKLRVYGRNTRGTSYYVCAPILVIVEA